MLRKALACREDLLWGKTKVQQLRGNKRVDVTPFNLIHGVANIAELKALDTSKYFFAVSYAKPEMAIYAYDPTETAPADDIEYFQPNTGSGRWVKRVV
jgi:hypothetical protein